jgi:CheY-like chemotaxis protein
MKKYLSILVIDDEPEIVHLLSEFLIDQGHMVDFAFSGNEAVEKIKSRFFDVIVSDYRMPDGNGMSVLDYVRSLHQPPAFFFLSGDPEMTPEECLNKGAKAFIWKPMDFNELIHLIETDAA